MFRNGVGVRFFREMSVDILRVLGGGGGLRKVVGRVYFVYGDGEGILFLVRCEFCVFF